MKKTHKTQKMQKSQKKNTTPQNDCLNLSFVKDIKVVGKKWLEMVIKWTFVSDNNFETPSM